MEDKRPFCRLGCLLETPKSDQWRMKGPFLRPGQLLGNHRNNSRRTKEEFCWGTVSTDTETITGGQQNNSVGAKFQDLQKRFAEDSWIVLSIGVILLRPFLPHELHSCLQTLRLQHLRASKRVRACMRRLHGLVTACVHLYEQCKRALMRASAYMRTSLSVSACVCTTEGNSPSVQCGHCVRDPGPILI